MSFIVKICGITCEEDAAVAIEAGANALGFNFYTRSPRYITPERARQISGAVSGHYLRVGVFVNPSEVELRQTAEQANLDILQLHGDASAFLPAPYRLWKSVDPTKPVPETSSAYEAYLLDTPSKGFGGSGIAFPWDLAARFPYRAVVAGGLNASNVAQAITIARPWGVDACSRIECSPGRKDAQQVRAFVAAAWSAASQVFSLEIPL